MSRSQGFDSPSILDNDVGTLKRVIGQLTEHTNILLARLDSGKFKGDLRVDGDIYTQDIIMDSESLYLGKKAENRKLSYNDGTLKFANSEIGGAMRGNAVFVSATEPSNPEVNDLWVKI